MKKERLYAEEFENGYEFEHECEQYIVIPHSIDGDLCEWVIYKNKIEYVDYNIGVITPYDLDDQHYLISQFKNCVNPFTAGFEIDFLLK